MIQLFHSSGAGDFTILQGGPTQEECRVLIKNAARLLDVRSHAMASEILRRVPFQIDAASNFFNDEFSVLHAVVPLEEYERLRDGQHDKAKQEAFCQIAEVLSELGTYIRFISVEFALEQPSVSSIQHGPGLKKSEIHKLVYKYIGVSGGYLADLSYRTHQEFYIELDLDIDPYQYNGTTRERFIEIISESEPHIQAQILEGILMRFPEGSSPIRTVQMATEIKVWIKRLNSGPHVEQPTLRITCEVVERALSDAQSLLRDAGAASTVDRIHTALHGYLREVCENARLTITKDAPLTELFKEIREQHPAFCDLGPRSDDILRVLRSLATILDSFNPLRNKASIAHPNPILLPEPEAMLVINAARTILNYIDEKIYRYLACGEMIDNSDVAQQIIQQSELHAAES